eukprot:715949-Pleurochrysis_carterae.AAC.1
MQPSLERALAQQRSQELVLVPVAHLVQPTSPRHPSQQKESAAHEWNPEGCSVQIGRAWPEKPAVPEAQASRGRRV